MYVLCSCVIGASAGVVWIKNCVYFVGRDDCVAEWLFGNRTSCKTTRIRFGAQSRELPSFELELLVLGTRCAYLTNWICVFVCETNVSRELVEVRCSGCKLITQLLVFLFERFFFLRSVLSNHEAETRKWTPVKHYYRYILALCFKFFKRPKLYNASNIYGQQMPTEISNYPPVQTKYLTVSCFLMLGLCFIHKSRVCTNAKPI